MKFNHFLFVGLFFISNLAMAITDFRPGFIVTTEGDTLVGEIDHHVENLERSEKCRFRESVDDYVMVYFPNELKSFQFNDGPCFITKSRNGKSLFLQFLVDGVINLYCHEGQDTTYFFLEKEGLGFKEIPYKEEARIGDGNSYTYRSKKHIGLYANYMNDAPGLQDRISLMGRPEIKSLVKLVTDYHYIVCKDRPSTIFKKELPVKLSFEVLGGTANFSTERIDLKKGMQFGILTYLPLNMVNQYTFLRTGWLYSYNNDSKKSVSKIPLEIEHIYYKWRVIPKVAYGVNIYPFSKDITLALMGGVSVKLTKSIYFGIEYDIDLCQKARPSHSQEKPTLIPSKVFSQSILGGFFYKF